MEERADAKNRIPVKVRADHLTSGKTVPLMFREEEGPVVMIDRVLDVRKAASLRAGGRGMRYTVRSQGKVFYLFCDPMYDIWFIERNGVIAYDDYGC